MQQLSFDAFTAGLPPPDLSAGSVFGAISSAATEFLLRRGIIYQLQAGEALFEYGDPADRFYVVCKGSLDFYKQHDGVSRYIRSVQFGEETGFVPMIALHQQSGRALAREDSIVLAISSNLYADLHEHFAQDFGLLTLNLAREMARVIDRLSEALVEDTRS